MSHYIIIYKNDIRDKALQMKYKHKVNLRSGLSYAFFISHHQATGGDQCNTLALELVSGSYSIRQSLC